MRDIKWMMEGEFEMVVTEDVDEEIACNRIESALAFLVTWLVTSPDGLIKTTVFRKDTHKSVLSNFRSNHPLEHKIGVVHTLLHCTKAIVSDPRGGEEEKAHIKQAFHWNSYSGCLLEWADMPSPDQPAEEGWKRTPQTQTWIRQGLSLLQRLLQSSPLTWTKQRKDTQLRFHM